MAKNDRSEQQQGNQEENRDMQSQGSGIDYGDDTARTAREQGKDEYGASSSDSSLTENESTTE